MSLKVYVLHPVRLGSLNVRSIERRSIAITLQPKSLGREKYRGGKLMHALKKGHFKIEEMPIKNQDQTIPLFQPIRRIWTLLLED